MSYKVTLLMGDPAECRAYAKRRMLRAYEYRVCTKIEDMRGYSDTKAVELWGFQQFPDRDKMLQYAEDHQITVSH